MPIYWAGQFDEFRLWCPTLEPDPDVTLSTVRAPPLDTSRPPTMPNIETWLSETFDEGLSHALGQSNFL